MRAATPTAAGSLVVPNLSELRAGLDGSRRRLALAVRALLERDTAQLTRLGERLQAAPRLLLERRRVVPRPYGRTPARAFAARRSAAGTRSSAPGQKPYATQPPSAPETASRSSWVRGHWAQPSRTFARDRRQKLRGSGGARGHRDPTRAGRRGRGRRNRSLPQGRGALQDVRRALAGAELRIEELTAEEPLP